MAPPAPPPQIQRLRQVSPPPRRVKDGEFGVFEQEDAGSGGFEVDGDAGVGLRGVDGSDRSAAKFGMLDFGADFRGVLFRLAGCGPL